MSREPDPTNPEPDRWSRYKRSDCCQAIVVDFWEKWICAHCKKEVATKKETDFKQAAGGDMGEEAEVVE